MLAYTYISSDKYELIDRLSLSKIYSYERD